MSFFGTRVVVFIWQRAVRLLALFLPGAGVWGLGAGGKGNIIRAFSPSFPRRRESIFHSTKMDSGFRRNDEKNCGVIFLSLQPPVPSPLRRRRIAPSPTAEGGFTLIGVIFLIVVLAGLLVFMMTLANTSAYTATQAYRQTQTYAAARAGIDWGAYQVFNGGGCNGTFTLPAAPDYSVTVSCGAPTTHTEQGQTIDVYTITSTATTGVYGQPYYVSRSITASVSVSPP